MIIEKRFKKKTRPATEPVIGTNLIRTELVESILQETKSEHLDTQPSAELGDQIWFFALTIHN